MTRKAITINSSVAASIHPELKLLTDAIQKQYRLNNGRTALYWNLVQTIDSHIQKSTVKRLKKD